MKFLAILKSIGKDLGHVGQWIDDGLKLTEPILGIVDPPLGAIIGSIQQAFGAINTKALNASEVQAIVTAIAASETLIAGSSQPVASTAATPAVAPTS